jgi:putative flavoprotein involved in K+ transport
VSGNPEGSWKDQHGELDVLVIGAGQAGLAIGYHLGQRGAKFLIVDAGPDVGHVWRSRWDSLRLFTPAEFDGLPGTPFPAADGSYPGKDAVADYLCMYATSHRLPVQLNTRVTALEKSAGLFVATTPVGSIRARQVVVATGPFQRPFTPGIAAHFSPHVIQMHSTDYRSPGQFSDGSRVLVVGAANSGLQIAEELLQRHEVTLAVGSRPPRLPQRLLGRDVFHWLHAVGALSRSSRSRLARRIQARGDVIVGRSMRAMRRRGARLRPRLSLAAGTLATFEDGTASEVDAVLWATGYQADYSWVRIPNVIGDTGPIHQCGRTDVSGLFFLG